MLPAHTNTQYLQHLTHHRTLLTNFDSKQLDCIPGADVVKNYVRWIQGGAAEAAGYKPSEESLQRFWEHCEDILSREAVEVPEASLDADTQAQRLAHAKLEQVFHS